MGERGAAGSKSGATVHQSVPGLRQPTTPVTAGRKPAARPPAFYPEPRAAGLRSQPKTGRGAGQSPVIETQRGALDRQANFTPSEQVKHSEDPLTLDETSTRALLEFFLTLDRWDREANHASVM
jgi:hypothetical protein